MGAPISVKAVSFLVKRASLICMAPRGTMLPVLLADRSCLSCAFFARSLYLSCSALDMLFHSEIVLPEIRYPRGGISCPEATGKSCLKTSALQWIKLSLENIKLCSSFMRKRSSSSWLEASKSKSSSPRAIDAALVVAAPAAGACSGEACSFSVCKVIK